MAPANIDNSRGETIHGFELVRGGWLRWVWLALAAVTALMVTAVVVATTGGQETGPTATTSPRTTPQAEPSRTTPATARPTLTGVPVYWIGESMKSFKLYREYRKVPDVGGPVASAVAAMTRQKPLDPDYVTPWRPAERVAVSRSDGVITVDLSADAFANTQVGSELAGRALQQLVYTATAAAALAGQEARTVTVTVDGSPADAWGAVRVGEPMRRAPIMEVQAQVWLTAPGQGDMVKAGTVQFTGYGTSFEATFTWKILDSGGAVVAHGVTMGGEMGRFGDFSFRTALPKGRYTVEVSTDDPSGGQEGSGAATDDKDFTVR